MSKPIEWTREVKSTETTLIRTRLAVQQMDRYGSTIAVLAATPADLIAALAAMPAEEREKVLMEFNKISAATAADAVARVEALERSLARTEGARDELERTLDVVVSERSDALARAEKAERRVNELLDNLGELAAQRNRETIRANEAERERDRMAAEFGCCPGEIPDDGEIARVVRERGEFRDRAAKRELERGAALAKNDDLRAVLRERKATCEDAIARAIAAESAAAAQPPREYPLAEGSRWIENVIRSADGSQSWLAGGQVVTDGPLTSGLRYTYRQSARDLAALLAKGGLL